MATFSTFAPVRDDFRCSLCRQKNTFHCEHDTPYRDQLLGTYDQEKPYMISSNSRRESNRTRSHTNNYNNPPTNHRTQNTPTGRDMKSHADPRYEQGRRPDNSASPTPNQYYTEKNEQKKKNKSCVIL